MAKSGGRVLFQQDVACPSEAVAERNPQQCIPGVTRRKGDDRDDQTQTGSDGVHPAISWLAVLLQIKTEELVIRTKCPRFRHGTTLAELLGLALTTASVYPRMQKSRDGFTISVEAFAEMRIGILTGGGDCPGLNAVIRAVVRKGIMHYDDQFVGFMEGWRGVFENKTMEVDMEAISGILPRGGTILRTSRTNPAKREGGLQHCMEVLRANRVEALIAIGGDDTMSVAQRMYEQGVNVVGVPKTIDNDLMGTDFCFGFDTAVNTATEAIDRVHTTAEAHQRVMVVEVMGRDSGWIAMYSGIAGGADVILIPERPFDIEEV